MWAILSAMTCQHGSAAHDGAGRGQGPKKGLAQATSDLRFLCLTPWSSIM